jgi:hypothetical protein
MCAVRHPAAAEQVSETHALVDKYSAAVAEAGCVTMQVLRTITPSMQSPSAQSKRLRTLPQAGTSCHQQASGSQARHGSTVAGADVLRPQPQLRRHSGGETARGAGDDGGSRPLHHGRRGTQRLAGAEANDEGRSAPFGNPRENFWFLPSFLARCAKMGHAPLRGPKPPAGTLATDHVACGKAAGTLSTGRPHKHHHSPHQHRAPRVPSSSLPPLL